MGAGLDFFPGKAAPGNATQIKIVFTPPERLTPGRTVTLVLTNFSGADATLCTSGCTSEMTSDINSTSAHAVFTRASWTLRTRCLVLTVADGGVAEAGVEVVAVVQAAAGILYPETGNNHLASGIGVTGNSGGGEQPWGLVAQLDSFSLVNPPR